VTAQRGERNLDPNLSKTIWDSQWVEASSGSIKVGHDVAKLSPVDYHIEAMNPPQGGAGQFLEYGVVKNYYPYVSVFPTGPKVTSSDYRFLGFQFARQQFNKELKSEWNLVIPWWPFLVIFGIAPFRQYLRKRKILRQPQFAVIQ
ncbi:hypothetical protein KW782_04625, partial [Candidatus Parcubacteria bacterium]|nr:hypothetical protein [Candidatus Parcubacteria bacterium]